MPFFKVETSNGYAGCTSTEYVEAENADEAYAEAYEDMVQQIDVGVEEINETEYNQNT